MRVSDAARAKAGALSAAPPRQSREAVLAEQGLTRADLDHALVVLGHSEGIRVRSIVGINDDAVFGTSRQSWRADLPDACSEPFIPLLWLKILELLGRVPEGSTARFCKNVTLPDTDIHRTIG
jgi:hypothetical protein